MNYSRIINEKLDIFFDKTDDRYANMEIFTEIFDFMDNSDFKEKEPEIFNEELKRIRDLHNSFVTAYEDGIREGRATIEIAKNGLKEGLEVSLICEITGLTEEEINELK